MFLGGWDAPRSSSSAVAAWATPSTLSWLSPKTSSRSLSRDLCSYLLHIYLRGAAHLTLSILSPPSFTQPRRR